MKNSIIKWALFVALAVLTLLVFLKILRFLLFLIATGALVRVDVENYQRPQYFELVNLDGFGVQGNIYSDDAGNRTAFNQNLYQLAGSPGYDYGAYVQPRCVGGDDRYAEFNYESRSMCR
jgi:hypothetical protein